MEAREAVDASIRNPKSCRAAWAWRRRPGPGTLIGTIRADWGPLGEGMFRTVKPYSYQSLFWYLDVSGGGHYSTNHGQSQDALYQ